MNRPSELFLAVLLSSLLAATFNVRGVVAESFTEGWARTYGGTGQDEAYSVIQTVDGGYATVGLTWSYGAGVGDFWLIKVDANGNALWNKTYGGAGQDEAYSVVQTVDGGYTLAGFTVSYGAGNSDFWLVKTDSNGNALWNKTYGGIGDDLGASMVQTVDGGYAIAGFTVSYGAGNYDFWLVKTDSNGNALWNKTYGGYGSDIAFCMIQTVGGGYAIAGYTASYGAGNYDFWLVKTDSNGNVLWNKTYGGAGQDEAYSVVQTVDGGYAIAGLTWSYGAGVGDFWLIKVDANGNALWNKTYGGTGADSATSIVQMGDGGYALAGFTESYGAGNRDFWLVKVDALGVIPEFSSKIGLVVLMIAVTLTAVLMKKKKRGFAGDTST